jgi:poly-gamma-glutamate capsule biosynthesis protein CapA/YwtB (metallophosphatase superfamily)
MIIAGDVYLATVAENDDPFSSIAPLLSSDDMVYCNLEGALTDYFDPYEYFAKLHWKHPGAAGASALKRGNFAAVGLANNVIIGERAIADTVTTLDRLGIAHTGAGSDLTTARAPAIVTRNGVRYGFLARTSIFWPSFHRAVPKGPYKMPNARYVHGFSMTGETLEFTGAAGVATVRARTAYEPSPASTYEAGGAAIIHTWPDPDELQELVDDIKTLRPQVDILVVSNHWRLQAGSSYFHDEGAVGRDYRVEIAHAAIDAGADMIASHGTHQIEEIEIYRGKAIFYGLGELFFGREQELLTRIPRYPKSKAAKLLAKADIRNKSIQRVSCQFVLPGGVPDNWAEHWHVAGYRPALRRPSEVPESLDRLLELSSRFGTRLEVGEHGITVIPG